ncbi:MAG: ATP-binding protein [Magnetovibrionaceae bacterium]
MLKPTLPANERARLEKLAGYQVLDTETEACFDRITRIVAESLDVPISLVSLVDADRQWFKSHHGLDATETPREQAFCAHALHGNDVFVVADAFEDERFHDSPLVTDAPGVRFYAGAPLITPDGHKLGTLCAIDHRAHEISDDHKQLLQDLASLVIDELELRKARAELTRKNAQLKENIFELLEAKESVQKQARELKQLADSEARVRAELAAEVASKDRFFSIIAHDLKGPFTSILGLSGLISKMPEKFSKEKLIEQSARIHASATQIFELLENLLEWARVQMDQDNVQTEIFPLARPIEDTLGVLGPMAADKGITLSAEPTDLLVQADPNMVLLVIRNLTANALKFTPDGGKVTLRAVDRDSFVEVTVTDTGVGVSEKLSEGLFRIDSKTTSRGTNGEVGTGLGLPLCAQMVELNGGEIGFESTPGEGSVFRFTLRKPK